MWDLTLSSHHHWAAGGFLKLYILHICLDGCLVFTTFSFSKLAFSGVCGLHAMSKQLVIASNHAGFGNLSTRFLDHGSVVYRYPGSEDRCQNHIRTIRLVRDISPTLQRRIWCRICGHGVFPRGFCASVTALQPVMCWLCIQPLPFDRTDAFS